LTAENNRTAGPLPDSSGYRPLKRGALASPLIKQASQDRLPGVPALDLIIVRNGDTPVERRHHVLALVRRIIGLFAAA
jgi:hypothetical protein